MGEDSGDKSEEPTPHKLREARKKGQIAKSKEFTSAVLLFVSFYTLKAFGQRMWESLSNLAIMIFSIVSEDFSGALAGEMMRQSYFVFFCGTGTDVDCYLCCGYFNGSTANRFFNYASSIRA